MEKLVSNDDIKRKAEELVKALKEDKRYKEYINLRNEVKNNKDILDKMQKIKTLQKEYVKSAYLDKNIKLKINELTKELEQNPIYKDYLIKEKEINNILINISEGLNITFNNILNKNLDN